MTTDELSEIIQLLRNIRLPETIAETRLIYEAFSRHFPAPAEAQVESIEMNGVMGERITMPENHSQRVIFYLHGGGFVLGSANTHRRLVCDIAAATGAEVVLPEYRLAPEHPHPAALEDALTSYQWLLSQPETASRQWVIGGDSAGGNLVLATLISLRNGGYSLPKAAFVISPWADLENRSPSRENRAASDPFLKPWVLHAFARLYRPDGDFNHPLVSPVNADLTGLPRLLIQVGGREILYDDSIKLAHNAEQVGVNVELRIWETMIHAWHLFAMGLREGRQAIAEIAAFLDWADR